jgi:hypothetical protein
MPLFRRGPRLKDDALNGLAGMFVSCPTDPTPGADKLHASKLDFSVASLAFVDDYLEAMRSRKLGQQDGAVVVLRCGAYVGEVIRHNSSERVFHWLDYDEAVRVDSRIAAMGGRSLGLSAVLWSGEQRFSFPLAKVMKFLQNGREDSTQFFAQVMVAKGSPPSR